MPKHYFTVDVEEYFQVSALEPWVSRSAWGNLESRVANGVGRILALLDRHGARGTFFVLGWVAERHPELVREIASSGHEIASHGWDHKRVTQLSPEEFRKSVRDTKVLLEDLTGEPVIGYRAPSFSIVPGREWALDILVEEGYQYDSSLFPVTRSGYGYARGLRFPYWLQRSSGPLFELPPATLRRWGRVLPAGGGAYLRLLPYALVRGAMAQAEKRRMAATFYVHPWEVDPDQPRFEVPFRTRVRHYGGIPRTMDRLERLLSEFRFTRIRDGLPSEVALTA